MAFKLHGTLKPNEGRQIVGGVTVPQKTIIVNSGVMQLGDKVEWSSGFVQTGAGSTAATPPIGICVGVADKNGVFVAPNSGTTDTFTVASDNQTVAMKYAIIDVSTDTLYTVPLDATAGTTAGSNLPGYVFDALVSDGAQIDESTVTAVTTADKGFFSWGVDPNDSDNVIVNIVSGSHHREIA